MKFKKVSEIPKNLKNWWEDNTELMFRVKQTVILKIWPQILFNLWFSTIVVVVDFYVPGMSLDFPIIFVPILGVVISLLLVFRTNTAYDRYYEGRRTWSTMTHAIRVLTQCFWLGVKNETGTAKDLIEKGTVINLLVAFAYATKNYLREEYSYEADEEITQLISHVPKFQSHERKSGVPGSEVNNNGGGDVRIQIERKGSSVPRRDCPKTMSSRRRLAVRARPAGSEGFKRRDFMYMAHDYVKPTNIPLELSYYIDSYLYLFMFRGTLDGDTSKLMLAAMSNLMDSLTQFERILRTPIPLAYSVHLHHCVWLYLLSLPFQLVGLLGWLTVPAIGFVTFALQGILAIGWEIENPFGYDDNDLPLDDFCEVIRQEAQTIMSHKIPETESWTFTAENIPFYPKSLESAVELNKKSAEEIREILRRTFNQ